MAILKFGKPISVNRLKAHLDYLEKEKPGVPKDSRKIIFDSTGLHDSKELAGYYQDLKESFGKGCPERHPNAAYTAVLSFDPKDQEKLTDKEFEEIGKEMASRIALGHEYVIAVHRDEPHPHIHLTWSAIHPETGRLYTRKNEQYFDLKRNFTREIQERYGLRQVEYVTENENSPDIQTDGEYRLREAGKYVWKDDLKDRIEQAKNGDEQGFEDRLKKLDVEIHNKKYRGVAYQSYKFTDKTGQIRTIKAAKLGTAFDANKPAIDVNFRRDYKSVDKYLKDSLKWARSNGKSMNHFKHLLKSRGIGVFNDKRNEGKFKFFWKGQARREDYKGFGSKAFTKSSLENHFDEKQIEIRGLRKKLGQVAADSFTKSGFISNLKDVGIELIERDANGKWSYVHEGKEFGEKELGKWAGAEQIEQTLQKNMAEIDRQRQMLENLVYERQIERAAKSLLQSLASSGRDNKSEQDDEQAKGKKIRKELGIER